jgi:hypothetical protein
MWTKAVPFAQMHARGRWKVEFFCDPGGNTGRDGPNGGAVASPYPLAALGALFDERRDTVDPQPFP